MSLFVCATEYRYGLSMHNNHLTNRDPFCLSFSSGLPVLKVPKSSTSMVVRSLVCLLCLIVSLSQWSQPIDTISEVTRVSSTYEFEEKYVIATYPPDLLYFLVWLWFTGIWAAPNGQICVWDSELCYGRRYSYFQPQFSSSVVSWWPLYSCVHEFVWDLLEVKTLCLDCVLKTNSSKVLLIDLVERTMNWMPFPQSLTGIFKHINIYN